MRFCESAKVVKKMPDPTNPADKFAERTLLGELFLDIMQRNPIFVEIPDMPRLRFIISGYFRYEMTP
jgi:hypothetical protein